MSLDKPLEQLSNRQLTILLRPLKRKSDGAMPTKKSEMILKYQSWKNRPGVTFTTDYSQFNGLSYEHDTKQDEEEAAETMLMLSEKV